MDVITIPQKTYQKLIEKALKYEYLAGIIKDEQSIFNAPPTKEIKDIIKSFKATKLYNQAFLSSLEKGLKRSSYFEQG
ncbi:hypothetical protein COX24_03175 [bacterium (Candidatus Gribaldobacteria) CG23_combo_of_CG06-09_8_20_14_all_37_87_8]|uniref:Uncharacterized protein n=2 Tax=Candidatus Gribaldobacteria TaxID=2798536 RepID=A0A2G9ZEA2_9BACT|nr:MAG: hypothetical protein AUJ25_01455 [Parcubacteria group bacterium CG1_02_37_13]PIP31513.1 MAG: hypothetical protein COX24_03175 [bacterium (Candidatus Gribaldobacteria) CG23_combo_of_CG06-09_8_20_14_all_37_87_8]PIR90063.1 MAG: hypothetical protein COU05_03305 [bacterium (Candidatus Gribaldobacteria) CG10_big_fil_rev_8_21_14_0_10_37_21]